MLRAAVMAIIGIAAVSHLAFAADLSPEARYEAAKSILASCECSFDIEDKPQDVQALNEMWSATQDWAVDYLNKHPDTTAEKLRTVFLNANPGYQPLPADGHLVYVP